MAPFYFVFLAYSMLLNICLFFLQGNILSDYKLDINFHQPEPPGKNMFFLSENISFFIDLLIFDYAYKTHQRWI